MLLVHVACQSGEAVIEDEIPQSSALMTSLSERNETSLSPEATEDVEETEEQDELVFAPRIWGETGDDEAIDETDAKESSRILNAETSADPTPTLSPVPTVTASPAPTATPVPTATPMPTATPIPPTATPVPPTATPIPPTVTPVPPTATPVPTATPIPPTATPVPPTSAPPANTAEQYKADILRYTNEARIANGLPALTAGGSGLNQAAQLRAQETIGSFGHTRPNGSDFWTAMDQFGVSYGWAAENIAYNTASYYSAYDTVQMWMNSAGHRKNILNPNLKKLSVGYTISGDWAYITQLFTD